MRGRHEAPRPVPVSQQPRPEQTYTVAEAAAILRVSKMTVYRLVESGDLQVLKIGSRPTIRIEPGALRAYVRRIRTAPPSASAS